MRSPALRISLPRHIWPRSRVLIGSPPTCSSHDRPFMTPYRSRTALLCLTLLATGLAATSAKEAAKNTASWSVINEKDQATLRYGDDSEESVVVFSCKPH